MDNVQEQSNRTSDISHTRVMVSRANNRVCLSWKQPIPVSTGVVIIVVLLLWVGVSCRVVAAVPVVFPGVPCVPCVSGGGCVWGSGGMGTAPAGFLSLWGPSCYVLVRRRATLPHPVGCSTIAVPGLRFRVRNGSGRLPWAMAAANL